MALASLFGGKPKVNEPPPPPATPTRADASVINAGLADSARGLSSLISSGTVGLQRKAKTQKRSLIGASS